jgi:D-alanyl-D-alanine dipeptidase
MASNAFAAHLRWCEGTVMHRSTHAALALVLLAAQPVQAQAPLLPGFVDAAAVVDGLIVDMRYFGADNFVGERIDGYERPRCLLSEPAANALAAVDRDLSARGLGLKVFDCYRPQRAVAQFVRWAQRIDDVKRKRDFYPDVDKRELFAKGYISDRSGHSRGSTADVTLVRRADARELDMGSPFDFFSPKSWPSDRSVSDQAQQNRALLAAAMRRGGFRPYDKEWWHFTLNNEPFPDTYFDFPVR